jgi:hypothetical protein
MAIFFILRFISNNPSIRFTNKKNKSTLFFPFTEYGNIINAFFEIFRIRKSLLITRDKEPFRLRILSDYTELTGGFKLVKINTRKFV